MRPSTWQLRCPRDHVSLRHLPQTGCYVCKTCRREGVNPFYENYELHSLGPEA